MLLQVRDLHVQVDTREVVRGASLEIDSGEVHIIVGPNGAGKSSLLYAIIGHPRYRITRGSILFRGQDITGLSMTERCRLGLALMHQIVPAVRTIRALDLVKVLQEKYGVDETAEKIREILEVDPLLPRPLFHGLSGGERKRLELYIVSLMRPRLLMLDEPDSGVDIDSLDKIAQAINLLIDRGVALVIVTHRGDIVERIRRVDKVHIMCDGQIVRTGDRALLTQVLSEGFKTVCA